MLQLLFVLDLAVVILLVVITLENMLVNQPPRNGLKLPASYVPALGEG